MSEESSEKSEDQSDLVRILYRMSPRTLKKRNLSQVSRSSTGSSLEKRRRQARNTAGVVKRRAPKSKSKASHEQLVNSQGVDPVNSDNISTSQTNTDNIEMPSSPNHSTDSSTESNDADSRLEPVDKEELFIMCPKTPQQKEKTQLARQRQLEDMRVREAAEAREERLLKRKGLWRAPVGKERGKKITWKTDLAIILNYEQVDLS